MGHRTSGKVIKESLSRGYTRYEVCSKVNSARSRFTQALSDSAAQRSAACTSASITCSTVAPRWARTMFPDAVVNARLVTALVIARPGDSAMFLDHAFARLLMVSIDAWCLRTRIRPGEYEIGPSWSDGGWSRSRGSPRNPELPAVCPV